MNGKPNFPNEAVPAPPDLMVLGHNAITMTNQAHAAAVNAQSEFYARSLQAEKERNAALQKRVHELEEENNLLKSPKTPLDKPTVDKVAKS